MFPGHNAIQLKLRIILNHIAETKEQKISLTDFSLLSPILQLFDFPIRLKSPERK